MMDIKTLRSKVWLEPWSSIEGEVEECELRKEIFPGHLLFDVEVVAVSRNDDDVLFYLPAHNPDLAVVHLSYHKENSAVWPYTQFFDSFAEFEKQMKADHDSYLALWADAE
jgi:hypothetical protein